MGNCNHGKFLYNSKFRFKTILPYPLSFPLQDNLGHVWWYALWSQNSGGEDWTTRCLRLAWATWDPILKQTTENTTPWFKNLENKHRGMFCKSTTMLVRCSWQGCKEHDLSVELRWETKEPNGTPQRQLQTGASRDLSISAVSTGPHSVSHSNGITKACWACVSLFLQ